MHYKLYKDKYDKCFAYVKLLEIEFVSSFVFTVFSIFSLFLLFFEGRKNSNSVKMVTDCSL